MKKRTSMLGVFIAAASLTLSGCSSTMTMMADYLHYDRESLVEDSTLIIEGTPTAVEYTVLLPRFEGDTPEENPLHGLSESEKQKALDEAEGLPATVFTVRVQAVHHGTVRPDQEITIIQTGGVIGNTTYVVEQEPPLEIDEQYLIFATDSRDGAYAILGGSAGMYLRNTEGTYSAVRPSVAPFDVLSSEEVSRLTE